MDITELRNQINEIDDEIARLFAKRMKTAAGIADYKRRSGMAVLDSGREQAIIDRVTAITGEEFESFTPQLYKMLFSLSRQYQQHLLDSTMEYGLIGQPLGHSFSPAIHARFGDYSYRLRPIDETELDEFFAKSSFKGLNVTIPYKKTVMKYCSHIDPPAQEIGCINTVVRQSDGSFAGFNTDIYGLCLLAQLNGIELEGKKVLILGSGGTSLTATAAAKRMGAAATVVISRSGENNYGNIDRHSDADIIINTTPVGMYPNCGKAAVDLTSFPRLSGVIDVVYNPLRTALILQAESLGIPCAGGLGMLVGQAKVASEKFTGSGISDEKLKQVIAEMYREKTNVVIIGMPGSGKTTLSQLIGKKLGREVVDTDEEIVKAAGKSIPEIFAQVGEEGFRKLENQVIAEVGRRSGIVISTGGGCVTREENFTPLRQNGIIFHITRGTDKLPTDGRPLSQGADLAAMWLKRKPCYERFAQVTVDNNGTVENTADNILEAFYELTGN